ncbi:MAG: hypothetical protein ACO1Q7_20950 [Gemmatimonas sp.]
MTLSSSARRLLEGFAVLALLAAVALYAIPVRPPRPGTPTVPSVNAVPSAQSFEAAAANAQQLTASASAATENAASVVNANILSGSRRAPASRYVSPDAIPAADFSMPAVFAPTPASDPSGAGDVDSDVPALYGIVNTNGVWRALLKLEEQSGPTLLAEGDRRGSYRVVSIRSNAVVVAGTSGQRTLRLSRAAGGDSTGKSP